MAPNRSRELNKKASVQSTGLGDVFPPAVFPAASHTSVVIKFFSASQPMAGAFRYEVVSKDGEDMLCVYLPKEVAAR